LIEHSIDPLALLASQITPQKVVPTSLPPRVTPPTTSYQPTQKSGITSRNTNPRTTPATVNPPAPTTPKQPLPPKKSWYREQAAKEQQAYNEAQKKANPSATYTTVAAAIEKQLPVFDNNKLSQEAQEFLAMYELVIDGPDQLIFE
jgi:predicted component of type VI protein secretion system